MKTLYLIPCLVLALGACRSTGSSAEGAIPMDPHSFAEPNRVRVTHVDLDIELDFEQRSVAGAVTLELQRSDLVAPLVLDTRGLVIDGVSGTDGETRAFELGSEKPGFGRPLHIQLSDGDDAVRVVYHTTPGADALQWLSAAQTSGGRHPFLFTQGQAILTRTWIPIQDTPGVRATYAARVRAPEALTPVMSAQQLGRGADGAWRFRLDRPVPAYLIALACGDLESRAVSERCSVWAEPAVVDAARTEFEDTEEMIRSAEALFGPYRWGRYDLLILPPAFPYGGMENPLMTFATPTVIAGDKSLVSLVAHELAHSWSGNLVTNATWSDFWLNEGSTVYFEKRIMEEVFGSERADMERLLGFESLEREIARSESWQTVLNIDLEGRHPDDGFSIIPYEKGALFLQRLEDAFGREVFDRFLTAWFDQHAFQSVRTSDFEAFLAAELFSQDLAAAESIDVKEWLHEPGLPATAPHPRSSALAEVEREIGRWRAGLPATELETAGWVTQQWEYFLTHLPADLDANRMNELDATFGLTQSGNAEILCDWLELAVRHDYAPANDRLESFLMEVGRRKFLQPLYEELAKTPEGLGRARAIYASARPRYHAVSTGSIDKVLAE